MYPIDSFINITNIIKACMIKWLQNFDEEIPCQCWENLGTKGIKCIACQALRENWYEIGGVSLQKIPKRWIRIIKGLIGNVKF